MTDTPFAGKWSLATTSGLLVTLVKASSGTLGVSPADGHPPGIYQSLNAYGDPTTGVSLQAGNWRYLVSGGVGYVAMGEPDTPPATFVVQSVGGSGCRIVQRSADGDYYLVPQGVGLARVSTADPAPPESVFTLTVLTPGLDDIRADGALGDDLRGVSFAGADLTDVRFIASDLSSAVLSGATVTGAVLQDCTVDGTNLSGLDLDRVVASGITGTAPNFSGAKLHRSTNLQGAQVPKADFTGVLSSGTGLASGPAMGNLVAPGADFTGANLVGVAASGSTLTGATFTRADLSFGQFTPVDFTGASMDHVNLSDAVLTQSVFPGAQLVGADFTRAQVDDCTFPNANLTNAKLAGVTGGMRGVDLTGAVLIATVLSGLDLTTAVIDETTVFMKAQMDGVDLRGQVLDRVDFFFADLTGATLDGASLEGTNFASADLTRVRALAGGGGVSFLGCNLSNAKLADAHLKGARFGATDQTSAAVLSNLYMPNADLTSANLVAVDMSGVQWYGANAKANATMQGVTLTRANLATMDLSQARLDGADLSFSNLVNTNLSGAWLQPTAQGRSASLAFASLQGADLTQAHLPAANLTNAAVALDVTGPASEFVGVPLFGLSPTMVAALDDQQLSSDLTKAFSAAGYPLVATAPITVEARGRQWSIDNWDQSSGAVLQSGYGTFVLTLADGDATIQVHGGSPLLVIATDDDNQQLQQSQAFTATAGIRGTFDDQTTCPSGMRFAMLTRGIDWPTLMTPALPPHPPKCIPSPNNWNC